ncbi:MAG: hypothetical protein JWM19_1626 [Actinomycetia bacterium]|nr:hypothetical protein [Actinomycetes bacterium]
MIALPNPLRVSGNDGVIRGRRLLAADDAERAGGKTALRVSAAAGHTWMVTVANPAKAGYVSLKVQGTSAARLHRRGHRGHRLRDRLASSSAAPA